MPAGISWDAVFAGAAALFSFLSVVFVRLNYADTELERQNRIKNRISDLKVTVGYNPLPRPNTPFSSGGTVPLYSDTNPEYRFEVVRVLVEEKTGRAYVADKLVHGFDGEVSIVFKSSRSRLPSGWYPDTPPDFDEIHGFDFDEYGMECELYPDKSNFSVGASHADVERIDEGVRELLMYIEANLGNVEGEWED